VLAMSKVKVEALTTGNPLEEKTQVGPMIREQEAVRVEQWVAEAVKGGGRIVTGGVRKGAMYAPTIVADVKPEMRISCEELFGPAVVFTPFSNVEEALALANNSQFGLAAGVFTESVDTAMRFARELETGNIHINWGPQWRADLMPYGGLKNSGFGKEGPRYAVKEMTELKMVVFHLKN
jgi:acyl-CoA reductase-like NAD-dependent aldehyde dehydrogenase